VTLGEHLFEDRRLSHNSTHSCSSCHDIRTNGASANDHDLTPQGKPLALNTPTVFNATLSLHLNWEGNLRSLEVEAERTLSNPAFMGSSLDETLGRLRSDPDEVRQFRDAYGHGPDRDSLLDAIAVFERSLVTPGSRFDRWLAGDTSAITSEELSGYRLFKSLGCISCHQGVNVGGNLFERHGIFHPLGSPPAGAGARPQPAQRRNHSALFPRWQRTDTVGSRQSHGLCTARPRADGGANCGHRWLSEYPHRNVCGDAGHPRGWRTAHRDATMRLLPGAVGVLLLFTLLTWLLLRGIVTNEPD
jgi:cytochrome c peroxidase